MLSAEPAWALESVISTSRSGLTFLGCLWFACYGPSCARLICAEGVQAGDLSVAGQSTAGGGQTRGYSLLDPQQVAPQASSCWLRGPHTSALGHRPMLHPGHGVRSPLIQTFTLCVFASPPDV